jgi:hypothetical protein
MLGSSGTTTVLLARLGPERTLVTDDLDTYEVIPKEGEECLVIFGFHALPTVAPQCAHLPPFSVKE